MILIILIFDRMNLIANITFTNVSCYFHNLKKQKQKCFMDLT